jgi:hypothetical protein
MNAHTYICVKCRHTARREWVFGVNTKCPKGHEMIGMNYRWRAPAKNNDKAWKLISMGHFNWEDPLACRHNSHKNMASQHMQQFRDELGI